MTNSSNGNSIKKNVAVISMARNDTFFIPKWIDYYGKQFGYKNLYLILDGEDQPLPQKHAEINVIVNKHIPMSRAKGDKYRAGLVSDLARELFNTYSVVMANDIDEFLVVDPRMEMSLQTYLLTKVHRSCVSALGLDVGQHLKEEHEITTQKPFLAQRAYAHVSARYTKSIVTTQPLRWGSGFHRVKGKNFWIDPNLFLFHFGMIDYQQCKNKVQSSELKSSGWKGHLDRRFKLFRLITENQALEGDAFFAKARFRQSLFRPLFAWNKPGMLRGNSIVKIPQRFRDII